MDLSARRINLDIKGKTFTWLKVLKPSFVKDENTYWRCRCRCGVVKDISRSALLRGLSKSCGCRNRKAFIERNTKHKKSKTKLYKVYHAMIQRCINPDSTNWSNYGGRGIGICRQWRTFEGFYKTFGYKWRGGLTIERRDNDGDYSPKNCAWVTIEQNVQNRRNTNPIKKGSGFTTISREARLAAYLKGQ